MYYFPYIIKFDKITASEQNAATISRIIIKRATGLDAQKIVVETEKQIPGIKLPDIFMIWILPYDPFGDDRMIYTIKNMLAENNQIVYNDGSIKIFLYTKGTKGGSQELKALLSYMEHTTLANAVDADLMKIQEIVNHVKADPMERERYMTLQEIIYYEKRDSREAGLETGLIEGIKGTIAICQKMNLPCDRVKSAIIEQFHLTDEKAEEYIHLYWQ